MAKIVEACRWSQLGSGLSRLARGKYIHRAGRQSAFEEHNLDTKQTKQSHGGLSDVHNNADLQNIGEVTDHHISSSYRAKGRR